MTTLTTDKQFGVCKHANGWCVYNLATDYTVRREDGTYAVHKTISKANAECAKMNQEGDKA